MHEFDIGTQFTSDILPSVELYKGKQTNSKIQPKPITKSEKGKIENKAGGKTNPTIKVG